MRSLISLALPVLLLTLASGCRSTPVQYQREMALLRAEILDLEDKYYALKAQREREVSGNELIVSDEIVGSGIIHSPTVLTEYPSPAGGVIYTDGFVGSQHLPSVNEVYYDSAPPIDATPGSGQGQTPESGSHFIEPPVELEPQSEQSTSDDMTTQSLIDDDQLLTLPVDSETEVAFGQASKQPKNVDRIEIVAQGTRGKDVDGAPGDEGVELMITTVDAQQNFVEATGKLTVTIRDPAIGEVGKWTFLPNELRLFLSRDEFDNRGLLLHLPWTEKVPVSSKIDIRVEMFLGGIDYIATHQLNIDPPQKSTSEDVVASWAISDSRWLSSSRQPILKATTKRSTPPAAPLTLETVERPKWRPVR